MEQYTITLLPKPIKYSHFKDLVYKKHVEAYGKESADNILKTASSILKGALKQEGDTAKSNNILLVGKVQSGKTSNLEMLSALSFDNGFNILVIYGGYDGELLSQSTKRFTETFDINGDDETSPLLISTDSTGLDPFDDDYFENAIEDNRPLIIASMKRQVALGKVNNCFEKIIKTKYKAFIIDDEGDQASLNTEKNKLEDSSATYREICRMKEIMKDPIYYSVTATPQANIFQPDISKLMPDSIYLIPPANSYTGAETFHLDESRVNIISDKDNEELDNAKMTVSLNNAIDYYLIASAIMIKRGIKKSDMIVHAYRTINEHSMVYDIIFTYITDIKDSINNNDPDLHYKFERMQKIYNKHFFDESVLNKSPWNYELIDNIKKVVRKSIVIQQNSKNKYDENQISGFNHKIYIGGDLLQRGITFKKLVTTYFTRWAQKGNMDTSLQRARWFGYRNEYIDLCKIFTTDEIRMEFAKLTTIENDLWEQFANVQSGELAISHVVVDATDTSLNPARKNVTEFEKASFARKWNNQSTGLFDEQKNIENNLLFDELIGNHKLTRTSVGRNDSEPSAYCCEITAIEFLSFVNKSYFIFDQHPFNKNDLYKLINTNVCIELMTSQPGLKDFRTRTFSSEKISALQQGADTTDLNKQHYKGDSSVINNTNIICVQVFKIIPIINDILRTDMKQYMYSIHFPKSAIVFKKK